MTIETRAARADERPLVCDLINLAYDAESYGPSLANPVQSVGDSHMDPFDRPDNTRVLLVDGKIASTLHLWEREAHVCGETAPFGIVTFVATHPEHRRKGYARILMKDAEEYMRSRGWAYGVLIGRIGTYGGSIGWRLAGEKRQTNGWKYVVDAQGRGQAPVMVRQAAEGDVRFLSRVYPGRYSRFFGPVVRSHDYWRRWSLKRPWDGAYMMVLRDERPIGYFHISASYQSVDEIAWTPARTSVGKMIFAAAAAFAAAKGAKSISFWMDGDEEVGATAFEAAFGRGERVYCAPDGRPVMSATPLRADSGPDRTGIMTRYLSPGPGILSGVDSTEALTETMARYSWLYLDGDGL